MVDQLQKLVDDAPAGEVPGVQKFKTGAISSPRYALLAAQTFSPFLAPPDKFAYVPKVRSVFGNDRYGDCVTAEEGFAKSCHNPEIDINESVVVDWARQHGYLNGAMLTEVMDDMIRSGFQVGNQLYNDGNYQGVDYSREDILKAAIALGPVKVAIDAGALPSGAGNRDGWFSVSGSRYPNTNHSVSLCGYGPADWLYQQLGVSLPQGLAGNTQGYLLYTWATIGFVSHAWVMGTVTEAWIRQPTTVGVPPLPEPTPPTPTPTPTPTPPMPGQGVTLVISGQSITIPDGTWSIGGSPMPATTHLYVAETLQPGTYTFGTMKAVPHGAVVGCFTQLLADLVTGVTPTTAFSNLLVCLGVSANRHLDAGSFAALKRLPLNDALPWKQCLLNMAVSVLTGKQTLPEAVAGFLDCLVKGCCGK